RSEVLAFGVYELPGPADLAPEQLLDLLHARIAIVFGARAGDADLDVLELRLERIGPGTDLRWRGRIERAVSRAAPSIASKLVQRPGSRSFEHHGHVMPRAIARTARSLAPGVVLEVIARVPAPVGHIDPAAHGQRIVDHDDLLVVAAADRVDVIELQVDPLARQP